MTNYNYWLFIYSRILNLINIHLFHDDDNLIALEQVSNLLAVQLTALQEIKRLLVSFCHGNGGHFGHSLNRFSLCTKNGHRGGCQAVAML